MDKLDKLEYFRKGVKDLLGYNYILRIRFDSHTGKCKVTVFKDGRNDGVVLDLNEWDLTSDQVAKEVAEFVQMYYRIVRR